MENKQDDSPRTPLVVRIAVGLVAVTLVVIGAVVTIVLLSKFYTGGAPGCGIEENGIRVCLSVSKSHASATDEIILTTTVVNSSLITILEGSCPNPHMIYNGDDNDLLICSGIIGSSKAEVAIRPLSSRSFSETISASELKDGSNTIQANWEYHKSNLVTIVRDPASSEID